MTVSVSLTLTVQPVHTMVILLVGSATALMEGQEITQMTLVQLIPAPKILMVENVVGMDHVCVTNQTPHTLV